MNFDLDDDQRDLAAAAADFLGAQASPGRARTALEGGPDAHDVSAPVGPGRAELVRSGFATITLPEAVGGGGGSLLDLAVVAEQAGRVLAGPSLVTFARAAVLLADDEPRLRALGDATAAYAVVDDDPPGAAVLDAAGADIFLALRDGELVCGPGVVRLGDPIDATRGLGTVALAAERLETVRIGGAHQAGAASTVPSGAGERWARAREVGRVVLAAEGLGSASRALEMAVDYATQRQAFGRAIGSYQAVKHALVDAYVQVEQLRSLVWWAAWSADHQTEELALASAAAKAAAAVALEQTAETLIQVHGGIGFTWEHDAHLYWRRAKVDRFLLGDDVDAFDEVARIALRAAAAGDPPTDDPLDHVAEPATAGAAR